VRRSFDGVRVIGRHGNWTWNAGVYRLVKTETGVFDDASDRNLTHWGLGAIGHHTLWAGAGFSLYYFGVERQDAMFAEETARSFGTQSAQDRGGPVQGRGTSITRRSCSGARSAIAASGPGAFQPTLGLRLAIGSARESGFAQISPVETRSAAMARSTRLIRCSHQQSRIRVTRGYSGRQTCSMSGQPFACHHRGV